MITVLKPCIGDPWVCAVVYGVDLPTASWLCIIPDPEYQHRIKPLDCCPYHRNGGHETRSCGGDWRPDEERKRRS